MGQLKPKALGPEGKTTGVQSSISSLWSCLPNQDQGRGVVGKVLALETRYETHTTVTTWFYVTT